MTPLSAQAQRLRAHERWLARPSLGSIASRWAMSPAGVFLTSSPLFRLPESLQLTSSPRVLEVGTGRGALIRMLDSRLRFDRPPTVVVPEGVLAKSLTSLPLPLPLPLNIEY